MLLKLIFGFVGFLFGQVLGALVGVFLAHLLQAHKKRKFDNARSKKVYDFFNNNDTNTENLFSTQKQAGDYGEKLLKTKLSKLTGNTINGYVTSENILFNNQNFEIDFLVLIPKVGLVVIEVKYYSGEVYCTNETNWKQVNSSYGERHHKNASQQVLRTRGIFKKLLLSHNLDKWPIIPLVVFTHPNAVIYKAKSMKQPQTDVIKIEMLDSWIENKSKSDLIKFSKNNFKSIRTLIKSNEKEYKSA